MKTRIQYRMKEYNSAYDSYFGNGKGWIYVSNNIDFYYTGMIGKFILFVYIYFHNLVFKNHYKLEKINENKN